MMRRAPLLAVAAALVISLLAWFLLIEPQRDRRAEFEAETEEIVAQQQRQRLEIARLEEIKANELQMRAALARLEQYVPAGPAQPATIRQIQLAADASGVDITALVFGNPAQVLGAPASPVPGTLVAQIPITLTVEGGYFQGTDFARRIESELARAVMVDAVNIMEAPSPAGFPLLSITFTGRVFTLLPPEAIPGGVVQPEPDADADGEQEAEEAA